jgi:hypothetical protein
MRRSAASMLSGKKPVQAVVSIALPALGCAYRT